MSEYKYIGFKLSAEQKKERLKSRRQPMSSQNAKERITNFCEVNLGYTEEMAVNEAKRCLLCPSPKCVNFCPVNIKIPDILFEVANKNFVKAIELLKKDNALPAITGRVCPQEIQCEGSCVLNKTEGGAVAFGYIERFLADYALKIKDNYADNVFIEVKSKHKVAIVGSGPAGLAIAADLIRAGVEVHIFEAFHKAGGVLVYGIPEFRLPKLIVDKEIKYLQSLGVKIHTNIVVGNTILVDDLLTTKGFSAVFLAIGAGLPKFMNIDGENLNGVYSANEYLTRVNLMKAYKFPEYDTPILFGKKVAVIGGGNVAMDAVRTAKRLGATEAMLIYRRSKNEMPARIEEIHHAEEEGIIFKYLYNPIKYHADASNTWLKAVECVKMELMEPDKLGRRQVREIPNTNEIIEIDTAIVAIGTGSNPILTQANSDIKVNKWGYIEVNDRGATSKKGVFAGGDIVRGAATVILAMGDGRLAAQSILEYLYNNA